jgi:hypothetical protein
MNGDEIGNRLLRLNFALRKIGIRQEKAASYLMAFGVSDGVLIE